jgi:hypothetical protein
MLNNGFYLYLSDGYTKHTKIRELQIMVPFLSFANHLGFNKSIEIPPTDINAAPVLIADYNQHESDVLPFGDFEFSKMPGLSVIDKDGVSILEGVVHINFSNVNGSNVAKVEREIVLRSLETFINGDYGEKHSIKLKYFDASSAPPPNRHAKSPAIVNVVFGGQRAINLF